MLSAYAGDRLDSAWWPGHAPATQHMSVYVEDCLSRFRPGVEDDAVAAVGEPLGLRNLVSLGRHLGQQPSIRAGQRGQVRVVVPGDDQDMRRSLRVDIAKRDRAVTLSHSFRWDITRDDLAEEAVCHAGNRSLTGDNSPHMGPMASPRTISLTWLRTHGARPEGARPGRAVSPVYPGATPKSGRTRRDTHDPLVGVEILDVRPPLWNLLAILL